MIGLLEPETTGGGKQFHGPCWKLAIKTDFTTFEGIL